jgi:hypothetical protein
MNKAPMERFPSCLAFARALSSAVDGLPMADETVVLRRRPRTPTPVPGLTPEQTVAVTRPPVPAEAAPPETPSITQPPTAGTTPSASRTVTVTLPPFQPSPGRLAAGLLGLAVLVAVVALGVARLTPGGLGAPARGGTGAEPGTVLLRDTFDDPTRGFLDRAAPTDQFRLGYVDGEYEIAGARGGFVALPGTYGDATVTVDAHLSGSQAPGRTIGVVCRAGDKGWYQLTITPDERTFSIFRYTFVDGGFTPLINDSPSSAILTGSTQNHIELSCYGDTIEARVNGQQLGLVHDATYRDGWMQLSITAKGDPEPGGEVALRLDNLVITQK